MYYFVERISCSSRTCQLFRDLERMELSILHIPNEKPRKCTWWNIHPPLARLENPSKQALFLWGVMKSAVKLDIDSVDHWPAGKVQSVDVDQLEKCSCSMSTVNADQIEKRHFFKILIFLSYIGMNTSFRFLYQKYKKAKFWKTKIFKYFKI